LFAAAQVAKCPSKSGLLAIFEDLAQTGQFDLGGAQNAEGKEIEIEEGQEAASHQNVERENDP
jgi:hypothetical protein